MSYYSAGLDQVNVAILYWGMELISRFWGSFTGWIINSFLLLEYLTWEWSKYKDKPFITLSKWLFFMQIMNLWNFPWDCDRLVITLYFIINVSCGWYWILILDNGTEGQTGWPGSRITEQSNNLTFSSYYFSFNINSVTNWSHKHKSTANNARYLLTLCNILINFKIIRYIFILNGERDLMVRFNGPLSLINQNISESRV